MWKYIEGFNGLVLISYSTFVFFTAIYLNERLVKYLPLLLLAFFALAIFLIPKIIRMVSKIEMPEGEYDKYKKRAPVVLPILLYVLPLLLFLVYFIAYYPGGYSPDARKQLIQAMENQYNDWHPVIHTLLAYKLPLVVTGNWFGSIVLFQMICMSAAIGYALNTVLKYTNKVFTVVSLLFVLFNPLIPYCLLFPHKDNAFAIGAVILTSFSVNICFSKGAWLKNNFNTAVYVITAALTTLVRHNAILFTAVIVIAALFYISKMRGVVICAAVLLICILVKYPLYSALGVEKPDKRQSEMLGLPMNVIANAVVTTPEALDSETLEFAYKILPAEDWKRLYKPGLFNNVKYGGNKDYIDEYGAKRIVPMMLRCFKASPRASTVAFIKVTDVSYSVTDNYLGDASLITPRIIPNEYVQEAGNADMQAVLLCYLLIVIEFVPQMFLILGVMHLFLLICMLSKLRLGKLKDWKTLLFILPAFVYNYASSLLLTEASDAGRYFVYTYMLVPVLLVLLFKKVSEERDNGQPVEEHQS